MPGPVFPTPRDGLVDCFWCGRLLPADRSERSGYPHGTGSLRTEPCPDCGLRTYFDRPGENHDEAKDAPSRG